MKTNTNTTSKQYAAGTHTFAAANNRQDWTLFNVDSSTITMAVGEGGDPVEMINSLPAEPYKTPIGKIVIVADGNFAVMTNLHNAS